MVQDGVNVALVQDVCGLCCVWLGVTWSSATQKLDNPDVNRDSDGQFR